VHGQIAPPVEQRGLQFPGEEPDAFQRLEGDGGRAIAGGLNDHRLEMNPRNALAESIDNDLCLP
jgi:hypothetical protein